MRAIYERCCGLDVHKKTVVACLITPAGRVVRTFGTMTGELLRLVDWLQGEGVAQVAMESTGVYWKPVYNLLEEAGLEAMVVNARHIKAVPGRKTDVKDAEWIAELLQHGLLRPSFIPDRPQRELRELVIYRRTLIEQRAHEVQRIQKVLEGANIKLSDVATDILGKSGRDMLKAMIEGQDDPVALAGLARRTLKRKRTQLEQALQGSIGPHQRYMLRQQLSYIEFLEEQIAELDREIEERMRPFEAAIAMIDAIWGMGRRSAEQILAVIGVDMSRWPTHQHLASWAGLCPGNNRSAAKRGSGRTGKGNSLLKSTLTEAAWSVIRNPNSYSAVQYRRIAARRGKQRAIGAVAHSLLVAIYHMLSDGTAYQDLGAGYFDQRDRDQATRRSVRRLESLGFKVTLEAVVA